MKNIKKVVKELGKRITALEDFKDEFVPITCEHCKRVFMVKKESYERFERQRLNIYCPFTRRVAKRWEKK